MKYFLGRCVNEICKSWTKISIWVKVQILKKNPDLLLFFGGRARPDTQRQGILLFYPLKVLYLFVVFQTVRDSFGSNWSWSWMILWTNLGPNGPLMVWQSGSFLFTKIYQSLFFGLRKENYFLKVYVSSIFAEIIYRSISIGELAFP